MGFLKRGRKMCVWCVWGGGGRRRQFTPKKLKCLNKKKNIKVLISASVVSTVSIFLSRQRFYFLSQWTISFVYVNVVWRLLVHISLDHIKTSPLVMQSCRKMCLCSESSVFEQRGGGGGGRLFFAPAAVIYILGFCSISSKGQPNSVTFYDNKGHWGLTPTLNPHVGLNRLFFSLFLFTNTFKFAFYAI